MQYCTVPALLSCCSQVSAETSVAIVHAHSVIAFAPSFSAGTVPTMNCCYCPSAHSLFAPLNSCTRVSSLPVVFRALSTHTYASLKYSLLPRESKMAFSHVYETDQSQVVSTVQVGPVPCLQQHMPALVHDAYYTFLPNRAAVPTHLCPTQSLHTRVSIGMLVCSCPRLANQHPF